MLYNQEHHDIRRYYYHGKIGLFKFGWAYGSKLQEGRNARRSSVEELTTQKADKRWKVNMELDSGEIDCIDGR
jgi:hypothetical protein